MNEKSFNCIRINCSALQQNYHVVKNIAGNDVKLMAMVKADAYGHGMVKAAEAFLRAGCTTFGVAELREGVLLRRAGIPGEIFVTIGFAREDVGLLFEHHLTPVIYSEEAAEILAMQAVTLEQEVLVHIKVDSGMSRLGLSPGELPGFMARISSLRGLKVAGVMSHFPESDNPESASTKQGYAAFTAACREIKKDGGGICHIANSGAILNFPATSCDMVRAGIALYGYHPAGKDHTVGKPFGQLVPAMSFISRILQVKTVPAGTGISYGHTYRTERPTKLAVLPVGYEDGYSRLFSNRGHVLIHGQRVPILGRVCMNMCMVDVTGVDDVQAGDEVVLLGSQGGNTLTADDLAGWMGSISYEVLCLLGNNNSREYY